MCIRSRLTAALIAVLVGAAALAPAAAAAVRAFPVQTVDTADPVQSLSSLAVAPDGTGGLTYVASVDGIEHLFVMRLRSGVLSAPVDLGTALAGAGTQPVLAAAPGGELIAAFVSGGAVYVSEASDSSHSMSTPQRLVTDASNPSLSLNRLGQGYLALTHAVTGGSDVEVYFWGGAHWHRAGPEPFNVTPADDAGVGSGRPVVVAAHDGVGLVAWGEAGHVYARRVWNTMTSIETLRLDPSDYQETAADAVTSDWTWQSAGEPEVASDGNSTYMDVAFSETMSDGASTSTRVFVARLVAENLASVTAVDGLTTLGTGGGVDPQIVMNERGYGILTAASAADGAVIVTPLALRGVPMAPLELGSADPIGPDAIPVGEGSGRTMTVWAAPDAQDAGDPQVLTSYSSAPDAFAPVTQVSSPLDGPVDYANGLLAAGDSAGDGLIVWLQGTSGEQAIRLGGVLAAPGEPVLERHAAITTRTRPVLRWKSADERFGPVTYRLALGGRTIASTRGLALRLRSTLAHGSYRWHVTAINEAGESARSANRTLIVNRYHPHRRKRPGHRRGSQRS